MRYVRRALERPFQAWVAVIAAVNVVAFFTDPNRNPIHELVAPWDTAWAITYGLAGVVMLVGIARERAANLEAAGLMLLLAGIGVQIVVYATLGVRSLNGTWATLISLSTLAIAATVRLRTIVSASRKVRDLR